MMCYSGWYQLIVGGQSARANFFDSFIVSAQAAMDKL